MKRDYYSLDPILQLLILLARLELSEQQRGAALALCAQIDDWSQVAKQAQQRFVLPLVYRHLCRIGPASITPQQLEDMRHRCLTIVQHNLHIASVQQQLVRELLDPLGVPHIFFKGHALAARYYDEPAMRFCRDIDLLVPHDRAVDLLEAALQQGYTPYKPNPLAPDRTSLAFAARVRRVITLVSPQGVTLEIHGQIHNDGSIHNPAELIANREPLPFGDTVLWVMPTVELFVYICLHHTRHYWSHLHWLTDLDAIQQHPDFDLAAVRACAERRQLSATVEACLELYHACAQPLWSRTEPLSDHGRTLLEACLANLQGDREVELALRKTKVAPDFAFAWQTSEAHRLRCRLRGWVKLLRPNYPDYQSWPLPPGWQWLYWFTRPFRGLIKRVTSMGPQQ